jgi:release factor glutamine methyltransferase
VSAPSGPNLASAAAPGRRTAGKGWTVLELVRWTTGHFAKRGIETPRLDAECLLAFALGVSRMQLYLDFDKPVNEAERARFRELVRRRGGERVPVALLTGRKEFWSLPLSVGPGVLVPRPETEVLVEAALELLPGREAAARILDVGTGSGAVALALARERPRARILASDISHEALEIARRNADELRMADRIRFVAGDLYGPARGERFDLVVSNPPYLADSDRATLAPELEHEPRQALYAGPDGLEVLRELVRGLPEMLVPRGGAAFEVAPEQADTVTALLREAGLGAVRQLRDLAGNPRVVAARGG